MSADIFSSVEDPAEAIGDVGSISREARIGIPNDCGTCGAKLEVPTSICAFAHGHPPRAPLAALSLPFDVKFYLGKQIFNELVISKN